MNTILCGSPGYGHSALVEVARHRDRERHRGEAGGARAHNNRRRRRARSVGGGVGDGRPPAAIEVDLAEARAVPRGRRGVGGISLIAFPLPFFFSCSSSCLPYISLYGFAAG